MICFENFLKQNDEDFFFVKYVLARGTYSLRNSYIDIVTPDTLHFEIDIFGWEAGFGLEINCQQALSCTVNCYGNGCLNTTIAALSSGNNTKHF